LNSSISGISVWHGMHHEAQRLRTRVPVAVSRWSDKRNSPPSRSSTTKSGAGLPTRAVSTSPDRSNHPISKPAPTTPRNTMVSRSGLPPSGPGLSARDHSPQHVVEDPTIAEVFDLDRGVNPGDGVEPDLGPVGTGRCHPDGLTWLQVVVEGDVEGLGAIQSEDIGILAIQESQW